MDLRVDFKTAFSSRPQILLTLETFDFQNGPGANFKLVLRKVTKEYFIYRARVFNSKLVYTLKVRWLAFLDTSSRVVYKNFYTPQLNKARPANTVAVRNVYVRFGKLYEQPPTVAPFLIGMVAPGGRSISINLNVLAVSRRGAWIQTTADFDS